MKRADYISKIRAEAGRKGGPARAAKLSARRRRIIAAMGGTQAAANMTPEERSARALRAWATRRANEKK